HGQHPSTSTSSLGQGVNKTGGSPKYNGRNPRGIARVLAAVLGFGIVFLVIGYVMGLRNTTPQYAWILGAALLCFVAALVILMRNFMSQARGNTNSLPRSSGWIVGGLMALSGALLVWGTFVDQIAA
ncbi:hypothetical protein, partial [Pseudarthrobacter polychromogenes]